jgi:hypothetical protein
MPQSFGIEHLFRHEQARHFGQCHWSGLSAFCYYAHFVHFPPSRWGAPSLGTQGSFWVRLIDFSKCLYQLRSNKDLNEFPT